MWSCIHVSGIKQWLNSRTYTWFQLSLPFEESSAFPGNAFMVYGGKVLPFNTLCPHQCCRVINTATLMNHFSFIGPPFHWALLLRCSYKVSEVNEFSVEASGWDLCIFSMEPVVASRYVLKQVWVFGCVVLQIKYTFLVWKTQKKRDLLFCWSLFKVFLNLFCMYI